MEETKTLCSSCTSAILCDTWGQFKCTAKNHYITGYTTMTECKFYKKRDKDFKESQCHCDDCLKNDLTCVEEEK